MTTVLIAGAGIAGTATAIACTRVGLEPLVVERHLAASGDVGAFLTLGTNGLRASRHLLADPIELGFPTPSTTLVSGTGAVLGEARVTGSPDTPTSRTMRRSELEQLMRRSAVEHGVAIADGVGLVDARLTDDGAVGVLSDGRQIGAALIVGADGVWSRLRSIIDPGAPRPRYTGLIGHGGYAPAGTVVDEPGSYRMIFGARSFFGYVVDPSGECWWFLNEPRKTEPPRGSDAVDANALRAHLVDLVRGDAGPAAELIEATRTFAPSGPIHTVPRLPHWHNRAMVVLGDAAHAPSPSSGQGASLAIEDAVDLAARLRGTGSGDLEVALEGFVAARRPRVESIIRNAARVNSSKAATGAARMLRDLILPRVLRATTSSPQLREAYDFVVPGLDEDRASQG